MAFGARRPLIRANFVVNFVAFQTYTLKLVTGLGYLALTWSTVVLLGGFVGTVAKEDFWCLTVISMVQAAGIFTDWGEQSSFLGFLELLRPMFSRMWKSARDAWWHMRHMRHMPSEEPVTSATDNIATANIATGNIKLYLKYLVAAPCFVLVLLYSVSVLIIVAIGCLAVLSMALEVLSVAFLVFWFGPPTCLVLSLWRIVKRNYGNGANANMVAALDIFYSLVICQGALFGLWYAMEIYGNEEAKKKGFEKYLSDIRKKCWQKPTYLTGWNLTNYAVGFLDSEAPGEYLDGARLLGDVVRKGDEDVRSVLLRSRPKTQKLIDTLRITSNLDENREIRELAATIVADLGSDIDLAQYPGAIRCISSLLQEETTHQNIQEMTKKDADNVQQQEEVDRSSGNELILQGLTILERLASNQVNCRDICSAPGLLPRIMAPIYSDTLIKDISSCGAWADVVNGSFKVLHQLIRAPGEASRRLRTQISSNNQAMSNLEGILVQGNGASRELQIQAAEILTQLALDVSTNLTEKTKENLINKLLEDFLAGEIEQEPTNMLNPLTAAAGRNLVLLSTNSKPYSDSIMTAYDNILARLTGLLDTKNNIRYRIIAAEILGNLCTHCDLDKEIVKETLLPKALTEILSSKTETREIKKLLQVQEISSSGEQKKSAELQEALLSLIQVICTKPIIEAKDFDAVVENKTLGNGAFVTKLKTLVDENCVATAVSLRIVKLSSQIAVSMMKRDKDTHEFKKQNFVESLSKAKKTMSKIESCMLFAGTDFGLKKTVRPLLSDIDLEAQQLVG